MMRTLRVVGMILLFPSVFAFGQASITAVRIPNAVADGGGSGAIGFPYAVFVRIQNWTVAANGQAYVKLYNGTNNEYMWSASGAWSNLTAYSTTHQPVVSIDAGGNWSGWIYAKHNATLGAIAAVRAARVGATTTNLTSPTQTFNVMDMSSSGNGGWIVRLNSPAVNKGIIAYAGGVVVGTYRTEDNGIAEGYSYGAGGFKIAVPAGFVDSLVAFNDDGTRNQVFAGPWGITAGQETDASTVGGQIGRGSSNITPAILSGGISHSLAVSIYGQSPHTIVHACVAVPSTWNWSRSTSDISLVGGGTPTASVVGDTIVISTLTLGGNDSVRIQIQNITPADSTANFPFFVKTGTHPDSVFAIGTQPSVFIYSTPIPLAVVQENDASGVSVLVNRLVTVRGVVTVSNQFNSPSYIQDNTGALAIFGSSFSGAVSIGDEVVVSGLVQPFSGLTEIVNPQLHTIASTGNIIDPLVVTANQIATDGTGGVEQFECRLVRLDNVTVVAGGNWAGNTNYSLSDATGTTQVRISNATNLVGTPIPAGAFDLIGVVGQFISSPPYIGGYQILPRFVTDQIASGPIIVSVPTESNISPTGFTVSWRTQNNGNTRMRYGTTPAFELGTLGNDTMQTNHAVRLTGLTPATVYYLKAFSVAGSDTSFGSTLVASTASPAQSIGAINAYFNKSVNTNLAWFQPANANQNLVQRIITRINGARRSVDACLYSLSGSPGPGTDIATALLAARARGVKVRVICEDDNRNTTPFTMLVANGAPLITDRFDPLNNGAGLMHNKFFVIDARGGAPESVWVWTGSWNPTDPGTNADYQNAIEFQDQAMGNAFTMEFNEMWGSDTDVPNASTSRFGARKLNNTPHKFIIGGKPVEVYFSPSDGADSRILDEINAAEHSIGFQLLTFTRNGIATAMVNKKNAGKKVRGDMDNNTDTGTQYAYLRANGVDVNVKPSGTSGLLHHKYGIIDAENSQWNSVTITGSHNWTSSAENANNENIVIIRDGNITNQYLQEFAARYYQFGGIDSILVGVYEEPIRLPGTFSLEQNYPNPFNPSTTIRFSIPQGTQSNTTLRVFDLLGREVATLVNERKSAGNYKIDFDATGFASGVYFYRLEAGSYVAVKKLMLMK